MTQPVVPSLASSSPVFIHILHTTKDDPSTKLSSPHQLPPTPPPPSPSLVPPSSSPSVSKPSDVLRLIRSTSGFCFFFFFFYIYNSDQLQKTPIVFVLAGYFGVLIRIPSKFKMDNGFSGALRPQKPYGLLGTGEEWGRE